MRIALNQSLASIHPNAKIGNNVTIEPFAVIHDDVVIGDDCHIHSHAVIHSGARLGKNVQVFSGAVVSSIPQDLKFDGEYSTCEIGDNTVLREYVTVNRGTVDRQKTVVGKNSLMMAYAHVAHDCIIGDHVVIANAVNMAGHVIIDDWARLGGMCAIHQFVKIGKHAMISGGSLIRKDVPPFALAGREPLTFAGVNSIGLKRRNYDKEVIHTIQGIYRLVYQSGLNTTQALNQIKTNFPETAERQEVLTFIGESERGIIKGPSIDSGKSGNHNNNH